MDQNRIEEIMRRIEEKNAERQSLLRQLRMWADVRKQGVDADAVASFGFDPKLVPTAEVDALRRKALRQDLRFAPGNPYGWKTSEVDGRETLVPPIFNYVNLRNGDRVALSPAIPRP